MHIVVCVKQVPDTKVIKINPKTNTLDRRGVPAILNPYDAHAVQEAVYLKQKHGGKITVLSMGPPQAVEVIKRAIQIGADAGYLISDRRFAGADTLATSYALFKALEKIQKSESIDMILCGKHAIDGDTGQVGPGIARRLEIPPVTNVFGVEDYDGEHVTIKRKQSEGYERLRAEVPCLLTIEKEINEIEYAPLPNMLKAARYEPTVWTVDDLEDVDIKQLGLKGSPTIVGKMFAPPKPEGGHILEGTPEQKVEELFNILIRDKKELFAVGKGE